MSMRFHMNRNFIESDGTPEIVQCESNGILKFKPIIGLNFEVSDFPHTRFKVLFLLCIVELNCKFDNSLFCIEFNDNC